MHKIVRTTLLACLLSAATSAQTVRIVDAAGAPGSYPTLATAIAASVSGDLVLIKPGSYTSSRIDGKALTVVADGVGVSITSMSVPSSYTFVMGALNLPLNLACNFGGLNVEGKNFGLLNGTTILRIDDCAGPIQINDCSFIAEDSQFNKDVIAGEITGSAGVSIVNSVLDSSSTSGEFYGHQQQHGLISTESNLFVYGSTIHGGKGTGGDFFDPPGAGLDGPAGWTVAGGFALGVRTVCIGSEGGAGTFTDASPSSFNCGPGGDGGPGLSLIQTGSGSNPEEPSFVRSSLTLTPGVGGQAYLPPCTNGDDGIDLTVLSGEITSDEFATRALETDYLARVGSIKTEKFIGEPFDLVWHVFGEKPANPVFIPELTGAPTIAAPYFVRLRGVIPASGEITLTVIVPDLGVDFLVLYEEAYFYDGTRFYLSNPQFSVLLADSF